jgi:hypothetical protein
VLLHAKKTAQQRQLIDLPENAIDIYETLRNQVLTGVTKPQGLSVILYHGILRGLQIIAMKPISPFYFAEKQETSQHMALPDTGLVRLLANIVLHKQSEIMHVY